MLRRSSGLLVRTQRVSARADNRCPALHRLPRMHYIVCVCVCTYTSPSVSNLGVFVCVCVLFAQRGSSSRPDLSCAALRQHELLSEGRGGAALHISPTPLLQTGFLLIIYNLCAAKRRRMKLESRSAAFICCPEASPSGTQRSLCRHGH